MKRRSSKRHLMGLFVSSWLLVLAFCLFSYGQNGANDNDPHATGYIPPTPEQERHLQETHPRIVKVWPNQLALARINDERKKKGQEPLPEKGIVPRGAEKAFTVGDGPVISGVPQGFAGLTALPVSVDNSKSAAFPEIRTQGQLGSCTNFAITYYQLTYTAACLYGAGEKDSTDDTWKFSPKWTYNMINGGVDGGSWPGDAYHVLEKHGAARWSLFPYQTNRTDPKSYREWCRDGGTWQDAIGYRIAAPFGFLDQPTPAQGFDVTWLDTIKGMLADGEVLTFATYITGWQVTTIKNDQSTPDDDASVGQHVASWVSNSAPANHMMTIVGYNDSIWTDINNDSVVQAEEKGALKIANSWGTNWTNGNSGFCWLAYDALGITSAVAGGPSSGRQRAIAGKVFSISMHSYPSAYPYAPALLAKFKLNHAKRNQLGVALATFDGTTGTTWTPGALQFQGGPYAFDGTTAPCEGTFVFDFTDVLGDASDDLYQLYVLDSTRRSPAEFLGYKLTDTTGLMSGGLLLSPVTFDNDTMVAGLEYPSADEGTPPVAVATVSPTSGRAPLRVTFSGSGSSGSVGDIVSYVWDFGDGSAPGEGSVVTHTYSAAGTYTATLTVADQGWSESSTSKQVVVTATGKKK